MGTLGGRWAMGRNFQAVHSFNGVSPTPDEIHERERKQDRDVIRRLSHRVNVLEKTLDVIVRVAKTGDLPSTKR